MNDDNNAIATRGQHQLEDGNSAITTRAKMLLQIKDNDAIVMRAMTPSIQWQECLPINNRNTTIVMRVTIAISTMAKPCTSMAIMPLQQGQLYQLDDKQQGQQC
jgi:hypothetical protein